MVAATQFVGPGARPRVVPVEGWGLQAWWRFCDGLSSQALPGTAVDSEEPPARVVVKGGRR